MNPDTDKSHFLLHDRNIYQLDISNEKLSSTHNEKLLVINTNNRLTFEERVKRLCKRTSQRGNVLARVSF